MQIINYISNISVPLIIFIILFYGILEKKYVYDLFIEGVKEGGKITIKLFPTLVGLFLAISFLENSGIIEGITNIFYYFLETLNIPKEVFSLMLIRPISGSAAIASGSRIIKKYGVDNEIGIIASVIMGATETTLYTIAVYTGFLKIKNTRLIIIASLLADVVAMITAIWVCRIMSMKSC